MNKRRIFTLFVLFALAATTGAYAQDCSPRLAPGATLLFPYFEVDLEDSEGATTLISIQNESEESVLAHAIVWTDLGVPVLDFDLQLGPHALVSLDLRRVLAGSLPEVAADGCSAPVLDDEAVASLQAALTGRPDPQDGLCRSVPRDHVAPAVGYVTVDVLNECSATVRNPRDEGYFLEGGLGVAGVDNVLWGDAFLINPSEDSAQGLAPVSLQADPELFNVSTFYEKMVSQGIDHRRPLGNTYRTRYLQGGALSGGTDLLIWSLDTDDELSPFECELGAAPAVGGTEHNLQLRTEGGEALESHRFWIAGRLLQKIRIGDLIPLPAGLVSFGTVDVRSYYYTGGVIGTPAPIPSQTWVIPIYQASGRYSAAVDAVQLGCYGL